LVEKGEYWGFILSGKDKKLNYIFVKRISSIKCGIEINTFEIFKNKETS